MKTTKTKRTHSIEMTTKTRNICTKKAINSFGSISIDQLNMSSFNMKIKEVTAWTVDAIPKSNE